MRLGAAFTTLLLAFPLARLATAQDAPRAGATISGHVRDAASGAPVANASVAVEGTALVAVTDSAGAYRLTRVPPGPQVLRARRIGYAPGRFPLTVPAEGALRRDLDLAQSALRMEAVTARADASGRARGELGTASVVDRTAAIANWTAASSGLSLSSA